MKVNNNKPKTRGKGKAKSSPRMQTITSMFKKQTAAAAAKKSGKVMVDLV